MKVILLFLSLVVAFVHGQPENRFLNLFSKTTTMKPYGYDYENNVNVNNNNNNNNNNNKPNGLFHLFQKHVKTTMRPPTRRPYRRPNYDPKPTTGNITFVLNLPAVPAVAVPYEVPYTTTYPTSTTSYPTTTTYGMRPAAPFSAPAPAFSGPGASGAPVPIEQAPPAPPASGPPPQPFLPALPNLPSLSDVANAVQSVLPPFNFPRI